MPFRQKSRERERVFSTVLNALLLFLCAFGQDVHSASFLEAFDQTRATTEVPHFLSEVLCKFLGASRPLPKPNEFWREKQKKNCSNNRMKTPPYGLRCTTENHADTEDEMAFFFFFPDDFMLIKERRCSETKITRKLLPLLLHARSEHTHEKSNKENCSKCTKKKTWTRNKKRENDNTPTHHPVFVI